MVVGSIFIHKLLVDIFNLVCNLWYLLLHTLPVGLHLIGGLVVDAVHVVDGLHALGVVSSGQNLCDEAGDIWHWGTPGLFRTRALQQIQS